MKLKLECKGHAMMEFLYVTLLRNKKKMVMCKLELGKHNERGKKKEREEKGREGGD